MTTASDQARVLEVQIKGKVCVVCKAREPKVDPVPQVAWVQGEHVLKCHCWPTPPVLNRPVKRHNERFGEMTMTALARQDSHPVLSLEEIKQYISPMATQAEGFMFLRFCQDQGLNPFTNEAYLIKYDQKSKAAIVIGIAALIKRAGLNPQYRGYRSGVVVDTGGGAYTEVEGSLLPKGATLVGGWAELKRADWDAPVKAVVALSEYNANQSLWKAKPGTMIEKVALAQGLRRAFPEDIEALYQNSELQVEAVPNEIIDVEVAQLPVNVDAETGEIVEPDGNDVTPEPVAENPAGVVKVPAGGVEPVGVGATTGEAKEPPVTSEPVAEAPEQTVDAPGTLANNMALMKALNDRFPARNLEWHDIYAGLGVTASEGIKDRPKAYADLVKLWS